MMSMGHNSQGGFGYPLHVDEHRPGTIDFDGVRQIPAEARRLIERCGEEFLTPDLEKQTGAAIAEAKRELFERHLAAMRRLSGGNQYDAAGRYIGNEED